MSEVISTPSTSISKTPPNPFHRLRDFKIVVTFYPIGSAPRLKVSRFTISGTMTVGELTTYVNKMLKLSSDEDSHRAHLYFHQCIELLDEQYVGDFAKVFGKISESDPSGTCAMNVNYSIGRAYL